MPTLVSTQTFVQGNVLNADALTNHVVDAKPLATFISGQDAVATPAPADEFLIATAGASPAKKVSLSTLAANLPTGTSAASLAVTGATTLTGALTANGNTILGDASTDTLTVNATSSFGNPVTVSSDTTLGTAAVASATWARVTTALTVTKTAHGLTTGNTRYLVFTGTTPVASSVLNGTYTVTVTNADVFTVTVADVGDTVGTVTWFERSLTLNATLTGPLQGNIPVNVASVEQATGDEFLLKDASDSNRVKTTTGGIIKAWAKIDLNYTTITGSVTRGTPPSTASTTAVITCAGHNLRVGDVIFTTGGIASDWYAVATVTSSSVFTVVTALSAYIAPTTINWYKHNIIAGTNVHCAYGRNNIRAIQVSFINKPPTSSSYANSFNIWGINSTTMYPVQTSVTTGYIVNLYYQTSNGFGFWLNDSSGGGNANTTGQVDFMSIW